MLRRRVRAPADRASVAATEAVPRNTAMTLCPVALAAGCRKCPIFSVCPLKTVIGDQKKESAARPDAKPGKSKR